MLGLLWLAVSQGSMVPRMASTSFSAASFDWSLLTDILKDKCYFSKRLGMSVSQHFTVIGDANVRQNMNGLTRKHENSSGHLLQQPANGGVIASRGQSRVRRLQLRRCYRPVALRRGEWHHLRNYRPHSLVLEWQSQHLPTPTFLRHCWEVKMKPWALQTSSSDIYPIANLRICYFPSPSTLLMSTFPQARIHLFLFHTLVWRVTW